MLDIARSSLAPRGARIARLRPRLAGWCLLAAIAVSQVVSAAATFTVTSTADSGAGSLRDAIVQANTTVQSAPYTINFNINPATDPGCIGTPKVCTIMPATDLPPILRQTTIDGYTQPGASPSTAAFGDPTNAVIVIVIDGSGSVPGTNGFAMASSTDVLIRGFSVVGWHNGFNFTGGGEFGAGQICGNYIGLLPDGITMKPNTDTGILGNGTGALLVGAGVNSPLTPGDRNVIAGSTRGIYQTSDFFIEVYGSYIGTDASGTHARPNGDGIVLAQSVAASTSTLAFNVVSGNTNHGYLIATHTANITNTRVGTTAPGTAALPNGYGITYTQGGGDIGKSLAADPGNIVSGNTHDGITFAPGTGGQFNPLLVLYTLVGTDINLNPLGNGGAGIVANGSNIIIGCQGFTACGNTIAYNGGDGVDIVDSTARAQFGVNSIYSNAGLGISFRPGMGPTPNDPGDPDSGPNNLQNHPILTSVSVSGGNVTWAGTLNSDPSSSFEIFFFGSNSCDPSGFGEGKYYLGFTAFFTDASGNGGFSITLPTTVPAGVTAYTALVTNTTLNPPVSSEFSACVTSGTPPVLQSAASRKVHGAAGTFDLPLSLTVTNPTTEPRLGPAQTIVFTFDKPITAAAAFITEGVATAGAPSFSGNSVIVPLTGVNNQQYVSVSLSNVMSSDGGTAAAVARVGFLAGDVNQNRVVSLADLAVVNAQLTQPVTAANFLKDINASGTLTLADKALANANLTKALPPP